MRLLRILKVIMYYNSKKELLLYQNIMESFVVSARKYRPSTFETVVGQSHITQTLQNSLLKKSLAHAFLFCGPRGVGKTTCARILAKAVNCISLDKTGNPCNKCESCTQFNEGRNIDIIEIDAASNNGVDSIRELNERVRYIPQTGSKSVYIIDEVHMLSSGAFNAFLKTLEEPPPHAIFILATTEKHKILPTILSRCQKFDFKRIKIDDIAAYLEHIAKLENIEYEYEGLQLISIKADGGMRDALSIFDQIVNFSDKKVTYKVVLENLNVLDYEYYMRVLDAMRAKDHAQMFLIFNDVVEKGFDPYHFVVGLVEHFRNLLVAQDPSTVDLLETTENIKRRYLEQAQFFDPSVLLHAFQIVTDCEIKYKSTIQPRLLIELTLIKLAHILSILNLAEEVKKN